MQIWTFMQIWVIYANLDIYANLGHLCKFKFARDGARQQSMITTAGPRTCVRQASSAAGSCRDGGLLSLVQECFATKRLSRPSPP